VLIELFIYPLEFVMESPSPGPVQTIFSAMNQSFSFYLLCLILGIRCWWWFILNYCGCR